MRTMWALAIATVLFGLLLNLVAGAVLFLNWNGAFARHSPYCKSPQFGPPIFVFDDADNDGNAEHRVASVLSKDPARLSYQLDDENDDGIPDFLHVTMGRGDGPYSAYTRIDSDLDGTFDRREIWLSPLSRSTIGDFVVYTDLNCDGLFNVMQELGDDGRAWIMYETSWLPIVGGDYEGEEAVHIVEHQGERVPAKFDGGKWVLE